MVRTTSNCVHSLKHERSKLVIKSMRYCNEIKYVKLISVSPAWTAAAGLPTYSPGSWWYHLSASAWGACDLSGEGQRHSWL